MSSHLLHRGRKGHNDVASALWRFPLLRPAPETAAYLVGTERVAPLQHGAAASDGGNAEVVMHLT